MSFAPCAVGWSVYSMIDKLDRMGYDVLSGKKTGCVVVDVTQTKHD